MPGIPISDERNRIGRFLQFQPAQVDAGEFRLLGHVAERSDLYDQCF